MSEENQQQPVPEIVQLTSTVEQSIEKTNVAGNTKGRRGALENLPSEI